LLTSTEPWRLHPGITRRDVCATRRENLIQAVIQSEAKDLRSSLQVVHVKINCQDPSLRSG
jgi:hypothetical protein